MENFAYGPFVSIDGIASKLVFGLRFVKQARLATEKAIRYRPA